MCLFGCSWLIVCHPGWTHVNKYTCNTETWQQLLHPLPLLMFPNILQELILQRVDVHRIILNEAKGVVSCFFKLFFFCLSVLKSVLWAVSNAFPLVYGRKLMQRYPKSQNAMLQSMTFIKQLFFFPKENKKKSFNEETSFEVIVVA